MTRNYGREEIRRAREARGLTTSERVRTAAAAEIGAPLQGGYFRRGGSQAGSGPVTTNIRKAADAGRWLNEVVARHNANVYGWRGGQPTGNPASTPGSLRAEGITEASRADALGEVVAMFRDQYGREPDDAELAVLLRYVDTRATFEAAHAVASRLGDESATAPPGSHSITVRKDHVDAAEAFHC